MRVSGFRADTHAAGGRIDFSWDVYPDPGETLDGSLPEVRVRRKTRDFEYPPVEADDPFVIYDGAVFSAEEALRPRFEIENGYRVTETVDVDGLDGEILRRRWLRAYLTGDGEIHHLSARVADYGDEDAGLTPGVTYYYQISGDIVPTGGDPTRFRAAALATGRHGSSDELYRLLPAIHQRYDEQGELRRFVSLFGDQFDLMRSTAEGLGGLHDVDAVDHRMLPLLAGSLGWDLNFAAPIPIRRHEIKYAAALYRITGTIPGCMIWAKRLTGWDARIKEFYRNVFFTNDMGNPDDETHPGSRTVDTSNLDLMAHVGTFEDELDYTYDTGTTDKDWYAYKVVGIFVRSNESESVVTVNRKLTNLVNNLPLFLPVNMRGVVVLEVDTETDVQDDTLDLLRDSIEDTG